jgi:hypothetical protein
MSGRGLIFDLGNVLDSALAKRRFLKKAAAHYQCKCPVCFSIEEAINTH